MLGFKGFIYFFPLAYNSESQINGICYERQLMSAIKLSLIWKGIRIWELRHHQMLSAFSISRIMMVWCWRHKIFFLTHWLLLFFLKED